jgi:hypothetical protein
MDLDEDQPHEIMNRFKWIDDFSFKIINKEGIEVIIDLSDNFREMS